MLAVALGLSPVLAFGLVAWWAHARSTKLEVVNMCDVAPASKRSKRSRPVDAVVLHQMSCSRGDDLTRYRKVTAHFVIAPDGGVGQLHPMSARLISSNGFNGRSVAIEFAGNLRSVNGKWWSPETHGRNMLTAAQVESGRKLRRHRSHPSTATAPSPRRRSAQDPPVALVPFTLERHGGRASPDELVRLDRQHAGPRRRGDPAASPQPGPSPYRSRAHRDRREVVVDRFFKREQPLSFFELLSQRRALMLIGFSRRHCIAELSLEPGDSLG